MEFRHARQSSNIWVDGFFSFVGRRFSCIHIHSLHHKEREQYPVVLTVDRDGLPDKETVKKMERDLPKWS